MNLQPVLSHGAPVHGRANLPVRPPEKLYGRESDLDSIHKALRIGTAVLVHGPAGVGKTALVAALAAGYAELPGGVLWLNLEDDELLSVLNRVARAYAAEVVTSDYSLAQQLERVRGLLNENRPLVVLDGQVRIETAREFVRECAAGIPLLLTSAKMLAGPWTPHTVTPLESGEVEAMLAQLAGKPLEFDGSDLSRLIEALAGMPLAVTLAARQFANGRTPAQLLAELPSLPAGQANRVMAVISAAYRLLPAELQGMVLLPATAFAGELSEELLADVSGAPGPAITARMRQLANYGFINEQTRYDQPCFIVPDMIGTFAASFLKGKNRLDAMIARQMQAISTYIQRHITQAVPEHYRRLAAEMDNITAAAHYAAANQKTDFLSDLVRLLEPASADSFVSACGFQAEYEAVKTLLHGPEESPADEPELPAVVPAPKEEGVPIAERGVSPSAPLRMVVEGDTLPGLPLSLYDTVDKVPLSRPAEPTPEPAIQPVSPLVIADEVSAVTDSGPAAESSTSTATADRHAAALEGFSADGNISDELAAIEALAALSLEGEKYDEVLVYVERGMALAEQGNNPQREGELLILLGDLQLTLNKLGGAETAYKEAITALRPVEAWLEIGQTLDKLASIYWEQGRDQDAVDLWGQTLPIFQRVERSDLMLDVLGKRGDTQADLLLWDDAQASFNQAFTLAQQADDQQAVFDYLDRLAKVFVLRGNRDNAILYYRRALHMAYGLQNQELLGQTQLSLARLLIDDTIHLNRTLQLLESASSLLPDDTDVQRLLKRAKQRYERLMNAGLTLPLNEGGLADYARSAFDLKV